MCQAIGELQFAGCGCFASGYWGIAMSRLVWYGAVGAVFYATSSCWEFQVSGSSELVGNCNSEVLVLCQATGEFQFARGVVFDFALKALRKVYATLDFLRLNTFSLHIGRISCHVPRFTSGNLRYLGYVRCRGRGGDGRAI